MEKKLCHTILVTGCGGDIGLGVGKILRSSGSADVLLGADINDEHAGFTVFDACILLPKAYSPDYIKKLVQTIEYYSIDLLIPTSEAELRVLFKKEFGNKVNKIPIVMANYKALKIGFDKLLTASFLKTVDLPYPWTKSVKEGLPIELPCIIKSRFSSGSKEVHIVNKDVDFYSQHYFKNGIWQEYLQPDDQEYTCGLYRSKKQEIRTIIIKRRLKGGVTVYGEVKYNQEIEKALRVIAENLDLWGSINVQLRLNERGPVVFEINPRFSSTVVFRHLLGFKDLIWSLSETFDRTLEPYNPPVEGSKIFRISQEVVIPG